MDQVHIKYHADGKMVINLNYFFPANQVNVRELCRIVDMDGEHRDEILTAIADNLRERVEGYDRKDQKYLEKLKKNLEIVKEWRARGE